MADERRTTGQGHDDIAKVEDASNLNFKDFQFTFDVTSSLNTVIEPDVRAVDLIRSFNTRFRLDQVF